MIQQHQSIEDGKGEEDIKKVAYLTHEFSPVFLDLVSQAFWDWIIKIAMIKGMATTNTLHSHPPSTNKAKTLDRFISIM
ncbi:MAG: hypothetical protein NVS3B14_08420 [Ktedonobacteraceae bacterium]